MPTVPRPPPAHIEVFHLPSRPVAPSGASLVARPIMRAHDRTGFDLARRPAAALAWERDGAWTRWRLNRAAIDWSLETAAAGKPTGRRWPMRWPARPATRRRPCAGRRPGAGLSQRRPRRRRSALAGAGCAGARRAPGRRTHGRWRSRRCCGTSIASICGARRAHRGRLVGPAHVRRILGSSRRCAAELEQALQHVHPDDRGRCGATSASRCSRRALATRYRLQLPTAGSATRRRWPRCATAPTASRRCSSAWSSTTPSAGCARSSRSMRS